MRAMRKVVATRTCSGGVAPSFCIEVRCTLLRAASSSCSSRTTCVPGDWSLRTAAVSADLGCAFAEPPASDSSAASIAAVAMLLFPFDAWTGAPHAIAGGEQDASRAAGWTSNWLGMASSFRMHLKTNRFY